MRDYSFLIGTKLVPQTENSVTKFLDRDGNVVLTRDEIPFEHVQCFLSTQPRTLEWRGNRLSVTVNNEDDMIVTNVSNG